MIKPQHVTPLTRSDAGARTLADSRRKSRVSRTGRRLGHASGSTARWPPMSGGQLGVVPALGEIV